MGRQMLGKVDFKVQEALQVRGVPWKSWGGRDLILAGDSKQAAAIGDEPLFRYGRYQGRGLNKPRTGKAPPGTPTMEDLTRRGEFIREELTDVVILR